MQLNNLQLEARAVNAILMENYGCFSSGIGCKAVLVALEAIGQGKSVEGRSWGILMQIPDAMGKTKEALLKTQRDVLDPEAFAIFKDKVSRNFLDSSSVLDMVRIKGNAERILPGISNVIGDCGRGMSSEAFTKFRKTVIEGVQKQILEHNKEFLVESLEEMPPHEIVLAWLSAEARHEAEAVIKLYARAFFDAAPSGELVRIVYDSPLDLVGFSEDLDRYQDFLPAVRREVREAGFSRELNHL